MKVSVMLPVMVRVDNMEAIFMTGNVTATSHRKHEDMINKHMNNYVEMSIVKTVFTKSTDYNSNILMKNLCNELHGRHSNKMIDESLNGNQG